MSFAERGVMGRREGRAAAVLGFGSVPVPLLVGLAVLIAAANGTFVPPHLLPIHPAEGPSPLPLQASFLPPSEEEEQERVFLVIADPPPPTAAVSSPPLSFVAPDPRTWRVVLGDLCQRPNVRRPAERSAEFAECAPLRREMWLSLGRRDLGLWTLGRCPPGEVFVPSTQDCVSRESVRLQHSLCERAPREGGGNGVEDQFSLCPPGNGSETWRTVRRKVAIGECEGEDNGCAESPLLEVLEPCPVPPSSAPDGNRSTRNHFQQALPHCPCPLQRTSCVCADAETGQPRMFMDCCCTPGQSPPCLCAPRGPPGREQQPPVHLVDTGDRLLPTDPSLRQEGGRTPTPGGGGVPPSPMEQPQPCPLVASGSGQTPAHYQALCSWMLDPLVSDPESRSHFLQCQPAPFNLLCGRWQRMPCAPRTVFEPAEQLCVWGQGQTATAQPDGGRGGQQVGLPLPQGWTPGRGSGVPVSATLLRYTCSLGGVPLGRCSPSSYCPSPAVCQTPCQMCCLYGNRRKRNRGDGANRKLREYL